MIDHTIAIARERALAAHPDARILRVRAPRALIERIRAAEGLPARMPRGPALPRTLGYALVRCDDSIEHIEVDLELTYRVVVGGMEER